MGHSRVQRKAQGGPILKQASATSVAEIIDAIQAFSDTTTSSRWLVQPTVRLYSDALVENADEVRKGVLFCDVPTSSTCQLLEILLRSLRQLNDSDFTETANIYPQPYAHYPFLDSAESPEFNLPSVLVAPEVIELDSLPAESEEEAPQVKKEEWPEFFLRLFDNDVRLIFYIASPWTHLLLFRRSHPTRTRLSGTQCAQRS
jgi:nuclear cap-binding protein subunit 1